MSKSKAKKPKRVIARTKGEGGDIQIKKLKRRERKFKLPFGPFHGTYASLLTIISGVIAFHVYVNPIPAFSSLGFPWSFLPTSGTLFVIAGFAFVAWRYGFKIKKYYKGFIQYIFVVMLITLLIGLMTPFVTKFTATRQSNGVPPQFGELDTTLLTSPYLSDLFNGLDLPLDLLNPNYEFIQVYAGNGTSLDPNTDQYLYRFRALTAYDYSIGDFEMPPDYITNTYTYHDQLNISSADLSNQKELRIKQSIQIIGSSLDAELIAPWHSSYGIDIKEPSNWASEFELNGSNVEASITKNIADQPSLSGRFDKSTDTGYVWFTSYFHKDDEAFLASNSITMTELQALETTDQDTFNYFGYNAITGVDPTTYYQLGSNAFATKINEWSTGSSSRTVYQQIVYVMSQLLSQYSINIPSPTSLQTDGLSALTNAPQGQDPVYYLFESGSGGVLDFIKAFTMTLRAMNIPARAVSAFSTGQYNTTGTPHFSVTLMDFHPYVEALIPVKVNGNIEYHWGIFNLFPNLSTLQYEQNSLGVSGQINLDLPQTEKIDVNGQKINSQQLGNPLKINIQAYIGGSPYTNAPVTLKLFTANELQNIITGSNYQQVFDNSTGIMLGSVTMDSNGNGTLQLQTFTNSSIQDSGGGVHNVTKIDPLNIEQSSYVLFAYIGFTTYNQTSLIFTANGTLTLTSDATSATIPFNSGNYQGYTVVANVDNTYTAVLLDPDNNPIANEYIDWFIMDQTNYQNYVNNPSLDLLQNPDFTTQTDANGKSTKIMHFNQSQSGQFFAVIALWRGTSVNGSIVLQVTDDFTIDVTATFNFTGIPNSPTDRTPVQTISATEVMFRNTLGVAEQPVNGTRLYYYLIPESSYTTFSAYSDLETYLSNNVNGTGYFNISAQISDSDATTDTNGQVSFGLSIVYGSLPAGSWKLVVVDHLHEVYADQGTIVVTQPAGFTSMLLPTNDHQEQYKLITENLILTMVLPSQAATMIPAPELLVMPVSENLDIASHHLENTSDNYSLHGLFAFTGEILAYLNSLLLLLVIDNPRRVVLRTRRFSQ